MARACASNNKVLAVCGTVPIVLIVGLWCVSCGPQNGNSTNPASAHASEKPATDEPARKWRILHIMSYHAPWRWTDDQFGGFKEALTGLDIDYRVLQMDTKRNSSEEWKQQVGARAMELIESWQPDLVYTNDDNAQEYVARHYVNSDIPFVFSGVNGDPEKYGFVGSTNVTGVLEWEHPVATIRLLKEIAPDVEKLAVFIDDGPTWPGVKARMQSRLDEFEGVEFVAWHTVRTFAEYKSLVTQYQTTSHGLLNLGIFTYKDDEGNSVPYTEVLRWTAENSKLPDCSFWKDRIPHGTLCAVAVSGHEQGLAAGRIARRILVDGESPANIPMEPTAKGEPMVSLARARKLGLRVKANTLLTARVVEKFVWDK